jgi:hypothetical protein
MQLVVTPMIGNNGIVGSMPHVVWGANVHSADEAQTWTGVGMKAGQGMVPYDIRWQAWA